MNNKTLIGVVILVVLALGAWLTLRVGSSQGPAAATPIATSVYACDMGKSITAEYFSGTDTPGQNGGPPTPGGSVKLALSDGRNLSLHQTISADGTRYSDGDPQIAEGQPGAESFVFWSKGDTALVLENNEQMSYTNCAQATAEPQAPAVALPGAYGNGVFSLHYPAGYTVDEKYIYQGLGPGQEIAGIKFTIPTTTAAGTNLSTDTYLSVEHKPLNSQGNCTAGQFLDLRGGARENYVVYNTTTWSVASSSDAAAGNRYEETVYSTYTPQGCVAVRYFIHYGAIENYPAGKVKAFDRGELIKEFDAMRQSIGIVHRP